MHLWEKLKPKSEFFNNVLKLFSSTVVAAIIQSGALLIIPRLYPPEALGNYQLLLSIILIFGLIASFKYELAIVLPKKAEDQDNLVIISFLVLILTTIAALLIFSIFDSEILGLLDAEALSQYIFLIPIGIFFTGLLQVCRYILIRHKRFGDLAKNKVYQSAITQGIAIGWGLVKPNFIGLVGGYLIGIILPVWIVFVKKLFTWKHFTIDAGKRLIKEYKKFPYINTPSIFLNNFSLHLPVFMFARFFDDAVLGWYALANQITVLPIGLIATSVSQVYYQAASERFNENPQELMKIYLQTVKKLSLVGLLPLIGIATLAPYVTEMILGEKWAEAGIYMQIISIGIYFRFVNIPIGTTFSIINRQEIALILIIFSVVIRYGAMYLFRENPISMLWALSISTAVFYALYNYMVYWFIRKHVLSTEA